MEGVNQAAVLKEDQGWLRTKCRKSLMIGAQRPEMLHNLKTQEMPLDSSKMSFLPDISVPYALTYNIKEQRSLFFRYY